MLQIFKKPLLIFLSFLPMLSDAQTAVKIDTLYEKKGLGCRALQFSEGKLWYGARESRIGYIDFSNARKWEVQLQPDSLDFRSLSVTKKSVFVLNAGSPAKLFFIDKTSLKEKIVYSEDHKKTFYDCMKFWNSNEGIALGDPIEDCFSILITRNGGKSWNKIPCEKLPKLHQGEAAFAASNTNIVLKGNNAWIVSGGSHARVFHSADKGKTWKVYNSPIVHGETMTGIFTVDFHDAKTGFIAGGNYEKPSANANNKAITRDSGQNWQLVSQDNGFGYASCVKFFPDGKRLISVGATGVFISADSGKTWQLIHKDYQLYTLEVADAKTVFAAGRDRIVRITLD